MKKCISLMFSLLLISCLMACGGNTSHVNIINVPSDIYSEDDIKMAIATITKEFRKDWSGCTLTEIAYGGDERNKDYMDWATRNSADEVIVLISSFDVGFSGGDGSLNTNSTYDDWLWILVRNSGGQWKHVDHGY